MALFKGAGVAVVTPMKSNFDVNFEVLEDIINDQIEQGTDAIIITGTTGEASTLAEAEHVECISVAVSAAKKRVPVIAGTGANSTHTALELSKGAQAVGADGLLVVNPYYNKATQKGLVRYFTTIASAVDLPIIMYNVPGRTGLRIAPETTAELAKNVENIVGMKDATADIAHALRVMQLTNGEFDMYSGVDEVIVPLLSVGGIGVVSVLSNIAPKFVHDMVMSYLNGDQATALQMQVKALDLCEALFCEVNPIPVKMGMSLMGWEAGPPREPLTVMEEPNVKKLANAMEDFGIGLKR